MLLTKDEILQADDLEFEVLEVPEWSGSVRVSSLTGRTRDAFELSIVGKNGGENLANVRAKLVAASVVDEEGRPMFTEKDVNKLGRKSGAALARVYNVAQRLNKMSDDDVDDLAKNS